MAAINVDKLSLKELVSLEARLQSAIIKARARERSDLKKKMSEMAETHGFSVQNCSAESLVGKRRSAPQNMQTPTTNRRHGPVVAASPTGSLAG